MASKITSFLRRTKSINLRLYYLFVALIASIATFGSLYFSEVLFYQPCKLCWYQRIAMYPIIIIALVGFFSRSRVPAVIILIMGIIGGAIAGFHSSLIYKLFGVDENSCSDALCSIRWINDYGIISIPLLSFIAFTLIIILTIDGLYKTRKF